MSAHIGLGKHLCNPSLPVSGRLH